VTRSALAGRWASLAPLFRLIPVAVDRVYLLLLAVDLGAHRRTAADVLSELSRPLFDGTNDVKLKRRATLTRQPGAPPRRAPSRTRACPRIRRARSTESGTGRAGDSSRGQEDDGAVRPFHSRSRGQPPRRGRGMKSLPCSTA